jgi:uncharacterized integral membrane protein
MGTLIITVLLGLIFAYFATLNTQSVNVNLANNFLTVPVYMLAIVSVLIGLLISGVISAIDSIASSFALRSRDSKIRQKEQTVEQLSSRVHELEIENATLKRDRDPIVVEHREHEERPRSFFSRFRYHPTA